MFLKFTRLPVWYVIGWIGELIATFCTSLREIINGEQDGKDRGVIVVFLKFTWLPVWYVVCWRGKIRGTFCTLLLEIVNGKQDGEDCGVIVVFLIFLREVVRSDWIDQYCKWYIFKRKIVNIVV